MGFYIEELPTELNGITMQEADYLADKFLKDTPCNRMWDAIRALRDFYEIVTSEAVDMAYRKTENCSEIPNNCEWSVEYAKEMLNTMPCEECGHWEHGAGDHYYCALLEMRQECCFESKGESTLMFANTPTDEPQTERNDR